MFNDRSVYDRIRCGSLIMEGLSNDYARVVR